MWNSIHAETKIKNGGPHSNYWDMLDANTPLLGYLLSNYTCMLDLNRDHSVSTNCDTAKTKIQRCKRTQKAKVVSTLGYKRTVFVSHSKFTIVAYFFHLSCCHGKQIQSKICFFRWHFPYFITSNTKNFLTLCLHEVLCQTTLGFELGEYFSTQALLTNYIKFSHRNNLEKGYWVAPPPCMKLFEVPLGIRCLKEQWKYLPSF